MNIMTIPKFGWKKREINKTINCNLHKISSVSYLKHHQSLLSIVLAAAHRDVLTFSFFSSEFCKPRRRPRTYYQRRRERVRKQAERELERQELEAMQVHNDLSDSDSSDEDFDCFEDDEIEGELEIDEEDDNLFD